MNGDFQEVDRNGKLTRRKYKQTDYSLVESEDSRQVVTA